MNSALQNLKALYEVGLTIEREHLPLDFTRWECDTFACLGGWYCRMHKLPVHLFEEDYGVMLHYFGLTPEQGYELFSSHDRPFGERAKNLEPAESLQRRLAALRRMIGEREERTLRRAA